MLLVILFSLKTMKSPENGFYSHSGVAPLFSMRTESLASWQSCRSVDADAWYKRTLSSQNPRYYLSRHDTRTKGGQRLVWHNSWSDEDGKLTLDNHGHSVAKTDETKIHLHCAKTKVKANFFFHHCRHSVSIMAYLHFRIRTQDSDSNSDFKPNGYIVPCRSLHTAQRSESIPESVSRNVNKP